MKVRQIEFDEDGKLIITDQQAFDEAKRIFSVLREKHPCPECEGTGEYNHAAIIKNNKGFCRNCDGTGISIPESEETKQ